jgi:hypothetical protein
MPNMSYCRFENTLEDLKDCYDALMEESPRELMEEASQYEKDAIIRLLEVCEKISHMFDVEDYEYAKKRSEENEDE